MARKFGGKYSPVDKHTDVPASGGASRYRSARVDPVGARANFMFLPAALALFTSLTAGATGLALGAGAAALLAFSAWLLREALARIARIRSVQGPPGIKALTMCVGCAQLIMK